MKRVASILVVVAMALLLSSCISIVPDWVVKLSSPIAGSPGGCAAVILDSHHALTAQHCADAGLHRTVLNTGQDILFDKSKTRTIMNQDLAILYTNEAMVLRAFAIMGSPDPEGPPARVYGFCPHYNPSTYRPVEFLQRIRYIDSNMVLRVQDEWKNVLTSDHPYVCGGDSGGPVVQNGKVVGIINSVTAELYFLPAGFTFQVAPVDCLFYLDENKSRLPPLDIEDANIVCRTM